MKIYSDDASLPYRSTKLKAVDSKRDIDEILAKYGITKIAWIWDLNENHVELSFELSERFQETDINAVVRIKPPTIWCKRRRGRADEIDWKLSLRIFHWYIKNQLAMTYAMQSEKVLAFLPFIVITKDKTVADIVIPRLEDIKQFKALPEKSEKTTREEIIDVES